MANMMMKKSNPEGDLLYARLNEIRLTPAERQLAKAQLARAEAVAGAIVWIATFLKELIRTLVVCPIRRFASTLG